MFNPLNIVIASTAADAPVPQSGTKESAVIARSAFCDEAISGLILKLQTNPRLLRPKKQGSQ